MTTEFTAQEIKNIIAGHNPSTGELGEGFRPASVMALFYEGPDGLSIIFTKRTNHLVQHSGQISFPGGMRDPEDDSPLTTALRETYEEIGVNPDDVEVWGRLNQEATISDFSVAPFVGMAPAPYEFVLNTHEVERLIIVPLKHLLDPDYFSVEYYPWKGREYKTYNYKYKDDVIWGATARMVHNLLTLLTTGEEPNEMFEYFNKPASHS